MTLILNNPGCASLGANTGTPKCKFNPAKIVGALLIPVDKVFTNANLETFVATMQPLILAGDSTRCYPIFRFDEIADGSEEASIKTFGYGGKQVSKEGKYDFTFTMSQGGMCHHMKLRAWNGMTNKKVIFFDSEDNVWGVLSGTDSMKGFSLDFFHAHKFKVNDGENQAQYKVQFALSRPEEMNELFTYFNLGESAEDSLKGNLDLEMYEISSTATKIVLGLRTACDKVSIYSAYSTDLDDLALWVVTKGGVAVVPTGIVAVPDVGVDGEGGWEITLTAPSGSHVVSLDSAQTLATAGVGGTPDNGYECGNTITHSF